MMLNEIAEFAAYTGEVDYTAKNKYDSTYLGRFTFDTLLKFEGLSRILTIIARGYMFKNGIEPDIDYARKALQACVVLQTTKNPALKRTGDTKQISEIYMIPFRSLWTKMAAVGTTAIFTMCLNLFGTIRIRL